MKKLLLLGLLASLLGGCGETPSNSGAQAPGTGAQPGGGQMHRSSDY